MSVEVPNNSEHGIKPDTLPLKEVGRLLTAIGNSEAKAITLLGMEDRVVYSAADLKNRMVQLQGEFTSWIPRGQELFNYCRGVFSNVGLVTQEITDHDLNTNGFVRTNYGSSLGVSFAGHLLNFSLSHPDVSLYSLFGNSQSVVQIDEPVDEHDKKRSPEFRYKIFYEVLTGKLPMSQKTLAINLQADETTLDNSLDQLNRYGILNYERIVRSQEYKFYQYNNEVTEIDLTYPRGRNKKLTEEVLTILQSEPDSILTGEGMFNLVNERRVKAGMPAYSHPSDVYRVLKHLETIGFAKAFGFSEEEQTSITLTESQRQTLEDLVTLLDSFQINDQEFILRGQSYAREIIGNPQKVGALMEKAHDFSPYANATERQLTISRIATLLQENPGLSRQGITILLSERYGKYLSSLSVGRLLNFAELNGLIYHTDINDQYFWYTRPAEEQTS